MKRLISISSLFLVMTFVTTQCAFAARIYNFLPVTVWVDGKGGFKSFVSLAPGQKSDSLNWDLDDIVLVYDVNSRHARPNRDPLCALSFGFHRREIVGGNYMTIGHIGNHVVCTVCDSNHRPITHYGANSNYTWQGRSHIEC